MHCNKYQNYTSWYSIHYCRRDVTVWIMNTWSIQPFPVCLLVPIAVTDTSPVCLLVPIAVTDTLQNFACTIMQKIFPDTLKLCWLLALSFVTSPFRFLLHQSVQSANCWFTVTHWDEIYCACFEVLTVWHRLRHFICLFTSLFMLRPSEGCVCFYF